MEEITINYLNLELQKKISFLQRKVKNIHSKNFIDSLERGIIAEKSFENSAMKSGWKIQKSDSNTDKTKHIDFFIEFKNEKKQYHKKFSVEVKSMKKIARNDNKLNQNLIWIEILGCGVSQGWLYGEADLIAFETKESFILVKRENIIKIIDEKLLSIIVFNPYQALYKIYTTQSNNSAFLTLIRVSDLFPILELQFFK